jgi:predicted small lipoprotein YifL
MRTHILSLVLVAALAPAAWCGDSVPLEKVPAAVKATALKESKNGTIESVEKSAAKDGTTHYAVKVKSGDKEETLNIGEDGHLIHDKKKKTP